MRLLIGAAIALTITGSVVVSAHEGAEGVVHERMEDMKAIRDQVKILVPMVKGTLPYDPEQVAKSARIIEGNAGSNLTDLFPEGTTGKPSEALPDIWEDWDAFSGIANDLQTRAEAVASIGENSGSEDDFKAAMGEMLKTCKQCHNDFRE
ncbi:cytochrome c [Thalassospira sp. MA62]|nr:cytochrome c [Thalassospira sp. MA62]